MLFKRLILLGGPVLWLLNPKGVVYIESELFIYHLVNDSQD